VVIKSGSSEIIKENSKNYENSLFISD